MATPAGVKRIHVSFGSRSGSAGRARCRARSGRPGSGVRTPPCRLLRAPRRSGTSSSPPNVAAWRNPGGPRCSRLAISRARPSASPRSIRRSMETSGNAAENWLRAATIASTARSANEIQKNGFRVMGDSVCAGRPGVCVQPAAAASATASRAGRPWPAVRRVRRPCIISRTYLNRPADALAGRDAGRVGGGSAWRECVVGGECCGSELRQRCGFRR